ncbi:KdsC family phosphatase [Chengkuizengella sp. SCS-71B]|uniref:KdsC family phosphatase n=1 Tax=Chengkuizengella sp. SCS-71B TaxID=3115290 RepID=UPI0032C244A7
MMIRLLVMDVDGTLTDGKIYVGSEGEIMKSFNVKDGLGINKLHDFGIIPVIITGRQSKILTHRANELNITDVYQGIDSKLDILKQISDKYECDFSEIAYIGDDENDLDCMRLCAMKGCPADAVKEVKKIADFVSQQSGGNGAVREFIEFIIS